MSICKQIGRKAYRLCISSVNANLIMSCSMFVTALHAPELIINWSMYIAFSLLKRTKKNVVNVGE